MFLKKGMLLVVSGPSGSGKGTLIKNFVSSFKKVGVSVSATTREKRDGELHGKDYYFITKKEFKYQLKEGNIVEYNEYCGNFYGTMKSKLQDLLENNDIVVLEIDVNGAKKINTVFDCVNIFVLPPSFSVLKKRLIARGTETLENVDFRLSEAKREIKLAHLYDYLIINEKLENAVQDIKNIIYAERLRLKNSKNIVDDFLR